MSTRPLGPQDGAHSKDKDKAGKSGPSSLRSKNIAGNRNQQTGETSAGPSRVSVSRAGLEEQKENLEGRIAKKQKELQELQRQKREKKDQLKAEDVTEVWMRSRQKELNELERLEKQTETKLKQLKDRLKRLERQEEPVERKERLYIPEGLGDRRDPNRRSQDPKWAKSEEQRWGEQSILEGRGLSERMLKKPGRQEGQYYSEEVIFTEMEMDWSEQSNDDEPFDEVDLPDPDAYEDTSDLSAKFCQASDSQPEPIDDDGLRPRNPMDVTSIMQIGDDDDDSVIGPRPFAVISSTTR
ncbi:MAG: hypothetical protein J3Q66DRAFT_331885 [Benniella sp.]|nr:MAG: hypothetical protein J3Q66DRAFT_331885 [Benniella sp.]